ncbi:MAG: hypothetical protein KKA84_03460 [Bacteroidetes bacterium]|nr:hypothetical protein [Bacteroidota bacterium]
MSNQNIHQFHIPVLGVGFSVDSALKVAKYGVASVASLVDDTLMENFRKYYLELNDKHYVAIDVKEEDSRAKRTTAYLNMMNEMVNEQIEEVKSSEFFTGSEITKYFEMLSDSSELKIKYTEMLNCNDENEKNTLQNYLRDNVKAGSIDVNIMTKLDKANYDKGELLPVEHNDAHAALRGYANSELESTIVFSAGMNPRLYGYIENFKDFFPNSIGEIRKKIAIKVSDYRSALIQGKFLAKKGLWVSEYRIESGLNCGGHAFATDGLLMGPILEEFKKRKDELITTVKEILEQAFEKKEIVTDLANLDCDINVQGGVGTVEEQNFLIKYYGVKSVGWGTPFLLVPEATNVDEVTLGQLSDAKEKDLYLSKVSPLGVPFNNLRQNGKDAEKLELAEAGKPGSPCPKKFLVSNSEFADKPLCTASITYLNKKIKEIKETLDEVDFKREYEKLIDKTCLCVGLSAAALSNKGIVIPKQSTAVSICPGPNMAYFSKIVSFKEMVDHIYGRVNIMTDASRPNFFIKELKLYIEYLADKIEESVEPLSQKTEAWINTFSKNLLEGIEYYKTLIPNLSEESENMKARFLEELEALEEGLSVLVCEAA